MAIECESTDFERATAVITAILSPDLPEIVALRRNRWLDSPTENPAPDISARLSERTPPVGAGAWQRLARQRLCIAKTLIDLENHIAYALDPGPVTYLYRVVAGGELPPLGHLETLLAEGEVAVARFAANGILEWCRFEGACDLAKLRAAVNFVGGTPLGRVFAMTSLPACGGLRLKTRSGVEPLTVDLIPPVIGSRPCASARRFIWVEQDVPMSYGFGTPAAEQMPTGLFSLFSQSWQ